MNINPIQMVDMSKQVKKILDDINTNMKTLNENMIITQENQVEIGKRLARIETKLELEPWQEE